MYTEQIRDMVSEAKTSVARLENKFQDLITSIDSKFETWKLEAISKIHGYAANAPDETNIKQADYDFLTKDNHAKENEISILQGELTNKNKAMGRMENETKRLSDDIDRLKMHISTLNNNLEMAKREHPIYDTEVSSLKANISKLKHEIDAVNITISQKDNTINGFQNQVFDLVQKMGRCEGEKSKLEDTVDILRNLQQQFGVENINRDLPDPKTDVPKTEDVIILHDSLFKEISTGLLKKEEISVKKIWTPRIYNALETVRNLTEKPKLVYLHCATNDLEEIDAEQIVSDIG